VTGYRHTEQVMGTVVGLDVRDLPEDRAREAVAEAVAWLHRVDETFSTYRPGSEVSRLDRGELALPDASETVRDVLEQCELARRRTAGYFDVRATGRLDPSGFVKGWSVERAAAILRAAGSGRFCVNGGGDVRCLGEPEGGRAWGVAVADPFDRMGYVTVVRGRDFAVATSGSAERGDHVVDPFTGCPPRDLVAVTVVGPDLTWTDVHATAAFARGAGALAYIESLDGFEGLAVAPDGVLTRTTGFARYETDSEQPA
jgi:thiamine biosynthesis lipoprotein